jgi:hypothetical protein
VDSPGRHSHVTPTREPHSKREFNRLDFPDACRFARDRRSGDDQEERPAVA